MEALVDHYLGNPLVLAALLFLANFVLEEGSIVAGAGLAAAGEINVGLTLVALVSGNIVSDWALYGIGVLAGRSGFVRRRVDGAMLERGRRLLDRGIWPAALLARLLPPVFMASGFVRVDFRRFAIVNGVVAAVYTVALFYGAFGINLVLFDLMGDWAWLAIAGLVVGAIWLGHRLTIRYFPSDEDEGDGSGA